MNYSGILTPLGLTKQAAFLSGGPAINITHMAIGDQNGTEAQVVNGQTGLTNEVYRAAVSRVYVDPVNANRIIGELVISPSIGGFWVREAALVDASGNIIAVANLPSSFKPIPATGASRLMIVSVAYTVGNTTAFAEIILDSTAVLATRSYTDSAIAAAVSGDIQDNIDDAVSVALSSISSVASDSNKLGGQLPAYYATASSVSTLNGTVGSLSTTVSANSGSITTLTSDLGTVTTTVTNHTSQIGTINSTLSTLNSTVGGHSSTLSALSSAVATNTPTGVEMGYWGTSAPSGWVLASGRTIGNGSSGGTERANDDTQALFNLLWLSGTDITLPIQTSAGGASTRGASASADWTANKRISLPDLRGRVGVGKEDMGGTAAGRMSVTLTGTKASTANGIITGLSSTAGLSVGMVATGTGIGASAVINSIDSATQVTLSVNSTSTGSTSITFAVFDALSMAGAGGSHTHTLTTPQMPAHTHSINSNSNRNTVSGGSDNVAMGGASSINTNSTGGGQAHPNVQPSIVRNVIIKL